MVRAVQRLIESKGLYIGRVQRSLPILTGHLCLPNRIGPGSSLPWETAHSFHISLHEKLHPSENLSSRGGPRLLGWRLTSVHSTTWLPSPYPAFPFGNHKFVFYVCFVNKFTSFVFLRFHIRMISYGILVGRI